MKIIVDIPNNTPVRALSEFAQSRGCQLYRKSDGSYEIRPPDVRPKVVSLARTESRQPQPAA